MRRRIVAAVSACAAGLALGVMPATGAFASTSDARSDYCSDWSGWGDGRGHCDRHQDRHDRFVDFGDRFNDVLIIFVAVP